MVRLDSLDPDTARLIRALLAQNKKDSAVTEMSAESSAEVRGGSLNSAA